MKKRMMLALAAIALLPVSSSATDISVNVRVAGGGGWASENWIEFWPDRGAYVADHVFVACQRPIGGSAVGVFFPGVHGCVGSLESLDSTMPLS